MRGLSPLLALCVLMAMMPLAGAQSAAPTIVVSAASAAESVSLDAPVEVDYTITFDSDNPFDLVQPRHVHVSVEGTPEGWTAQLSNTNLYLSPGDSATVTLRVSVSAGAEIELAYIVVRADVSSLGASAIPGAGPILDPTATATDETLFTRDDAVTRDVMEAVGGGIWLIMIAALVLAVIVIKLVVDRNRIFVALSVDLDQVTVKAGKSVAIPVLVQNLGRNEDTVVFHVMTVADGWSAALPVPELDLPGNGVEEMQLIVSAPKNAEPGSRHSIGVNAHSAAAPRRIAEVVIQVTVE